MIIKNEYITNAGRDKVHTIKCNMNSKRIIFNWDYLEKFTSY